MAQPELPDALDDAHGNASASADASPAMGEVGAEVAGVSRSSGERSGPPALPQRSSAGEDRQRGPDRRRWPDGEEPASRQLHPLPRGLVELYGLLAVLFVLVPEWMAGGALLGFQDNRQGSRLPPPSGAWKRLPELRLASLNLAELRQLAHERRLIGYSRQRRQQLTSRLLRSLKARP